MKGNKKVYKKELDFHDWWLIRRALKRFFRFLSLSLAGFLFCVLCRFVLAPELGKNLSAQAHEYVETNSNTLAYTGKGFAKSGVLVFFGAAGGVYDLVTDPSKENFLAYGIYCLFFILVFPQLLGLIFLPAYLEGGVGAGSGGGGGSSHGGGGKGGH